MIAIISIRTLDINNILQSILREFGVLIDSVMMMFIVHLMMEYNDCEYTKFLKVLNRLKLCCCFDLSGIVGTNETMTDSKIVSSPKQQNNNNRRSIDTKTCNALPVALDNFKQQSIDSVI